MVGCAAVMSLASCNGGGNAQGEAAAVEKAKKASICALAASGTPVLADTNTTLSGDAQDQLLLTAKQVTKIEGQNYTVDIAWSYDATKYSANVKGISDVEGDANHKKMEFIYPTNDHTGDLPVVEFSAHLTCGSASADAKYIVTLDKVNTIFDDLTIAQIIAVKDSTTFVPGEKMFALQNDDHDGYMMNHNQKYYYVRTSGKLIYLSPDKNWGLLADGQNVIQLYQISKCSMKDVAVQGKYLTIEGNLGNGYGNLQLSYITKIEEMSDHSKIAEPAEYGELKEGLNEKSHADYLNYAGDGKISNAIVSLTGVTFAGTDDPIDQDLKGRFVFNVKKGTHIFKIAYDYHVYDQAGGTSGLDAWKDLLRNAKTGETVFNIKGTCRYSNDDGGHGFGKEGVWAVTPFEPSHWVLAA